MTGNYNYCCIKNTTALWNLTPPANIALNTSIACDTSSIKVDIITDTMVYAITLCKLLEFLLVLVSYYVK